MLSNPFLSYTSPLTKKSERIQMRSIDPSRSACGIVHADFGPGGENGIPALLLVVVLWNTLETASRRTGSIAPAKLSTKELQMKRKNNVSWSCLPKTTSSLLPIRITTIGTLTIGIRKKPPWMIEASLRENNINARRDPLEDGSRKFSSCLTMKGAQREIVHEIKEATVTLR